MKELMDTMFGKLQPTQRDRDTPCRKKSDAPMPASQAGYSDIGPADDHCEPYCQGLLLKIKIANTWATVVLEVIMVLVVVVIILEGSSSGSSK